MQFSVSYTILFTACALYGCSTGLRCYTNKVLLANTDKFKDITGDCELFHKCILLVFKGAADQKNYMTGGCGISCLMMASEFYHKNTGTVMDIRCGKECETDLCNQASPNAGMQSPIIAGMQSPVIAGMQSPVTAGMPTLPNALKCYFGSGIPINGKFVQPEVCLDLTGQCIRVVYKAKSDQKDYMIGYCASSCETVVSMVALNIQIADPRCEKACKTDLCNKASSNVVGLGAYIILTAGFVTRHL